MSSDQGSHQRPPERLADRYQVQEEIGSGASAYTYRGWDERLERPVAIKILRAHYAQDETFARRFEREARSAASVSNGNVVDVYDFGREGDSLYIVMQLVEGEDLKHLIQREGPLDRKRVQSIIGQVLDGLQAIHSAGIVHRDIKPQNVLIGRDGVARVTDFGVAHAEDDSGMTTAGTTVGTAAYMAPEQAQANRVSEATDLYAVGVVLYEMLTGFLPFNAPTSVAIMVQHIQAAPVPPSHRLPGRGISTAMDAVVLQALAKDPADRFRSARAMKQAVFQALGGTYETGQTTVAIPAAHGTAEVARSQAPAPSARRPPQRRMEARPVPPPSAKREGAGLGGAVAGLLLVIFLAVAGSAAWFAFDAWRDTQASGTPQPTATMPVIAGPTATDVPPTETPEPEATDAVIGPPPTDIPIPTDTPEPTATEMPTETPTETPEAAATETPALIEPIDGTPFTTNPDQSRGRGSSEDQKNKDRKDQEKAREEQKKDQEKEEKEREKKEN